LLSVTSVKRRVSEWVNVIERLSSIAQTQPHAAYAAFTHGLMSKWNYLMRAVHNIGDLLTPLEVIRLKFLPSLTGQNAFNDVTRELLALPIRLGGLGIASICTEGVTLVVDLCLSLGQELMGLMRSWVGIEGGRVGRKVFCVVRSVRV
jgi:hypothetical protein